jgi:hypothetical protein
MAASCHTPNRPQLFQRSYAAAQAVLSPMQLLAIRCARKALIAQIDVLAPDKAARLVGIAIIELFTEFVSITLAADQILDLVDGRLATAGLDLIERRCHARHVTISPFWPQRLANAKLLHGRSHRRDCESSRGLITDRRRLLCRRSIANDVARRLVFA